MNYYNEDLEPDYDDYALDPFAEMQLKRYMQENESLNIQPEDNPYTPAEIQEMLSEMYEDESTVSAPNKSDPTNPSHYNKSKMQHWDVVEDWGLDYLIGCATKYLSRAGKKSSAHLDDSDKEIQDLEKSIVYIKKRIDVIKRQKYIDNDWK